MPACSSARRFWHAVTPEPQQPPEPARPHAVVLVVRDHLHAARNAEPAERPRERGGVGKRMATVRAALRPRKIGVEIGVHRAGYVRCLVLARAPRLIVELR